MTARPYPLAAKKITRSPVNFGHHSQSSTRGLRRQQRGVALFMVLMVSLIVTLLSVSLAGSIINELRTTMTGRDQTIARQAAEAALRDAEQDVRCQRWTPVTGSWGLTVYNPNWLTGSTEGTPRKHCLQNPAAAEQVGLAGATTACSNGLVLANITDAGATAPTLPDFTDSACYMEYGGITLQKGFSTTSGMGQVSKMPRYTIQVYGFQNHGQTGEVIPLYRIRARGFGRNENSIVDIEEVYRPL